MKRNSSRPKRRYGDAGFTLVELVVVIAVLAILAGVGAVAYNGYIEYAKKGQDRATVGEIMHALELANYSDPGAITSTKVFFTADNGICASSETVKKALEDAFGEGTLENTKPSSSDWIDQAYTIDLSDIKSLLNGKDLSTLSSLNAYKAATANGSSASFAQDVDELWGKVEELVALINMDPGFQSAFGTDNLKNAVNYHNNIKDDVIKKWTLQDDTNNAFPSPMEDGHYASANIARNYSFACYALKHPSLTPDMKKTIETYTSKLYNPDASGELGSIILESYINDGRFSGSEWTAIKNDYVASGQANLDALAYMGILDVAQQTMSGDPTDSEFANQFKGYTNSLSAVLADSSLLDTLSGEIAPINISGNGICINVTKMADGSLHFDCDPPSANPQGGEDSGSAEEKPGSSACGEDHSQFSSTVTLTFSSSDNTNYAAAQTITLCSKVTEYSSCTVTSPQYTFSNSNFTIEEITGPVTFDLTNGKLEATGSGSATVKLKLTESGLLGIFTKYISFTVNVH